MTESYCWLSLALSAALLSPVPVFSTPALAESTPPETQTLAQISATSLTGQLDETSPAFDDGSYYATHTLEGNAGEIIQIDLVSEDFDAYLILLDSEGNSLAQDDDGGGNSHARLVITLPATGTYQIVVNTYQVGTIGQYRLSWRPATATDVARRDALQQANELTQRVTELYQSGRYSEAIPLAEEALRIRQTILGETDPTVATSLNKLALLYHEQGNYAAALPLYQRALSIWETALGESHPDVAASLNNLAALHQAQGNYAAALPLFQRALSIWETTLGETHPLVATSLNNLAKLYHDQSNYAAALPLFQRALSILAATQGETHPDVANGLNNLAALHQAQGNYAAALPLYQRAISILATALGETHPDVANSLNNLASLYHDQGDYAAAFPLYQRVLSIRETALGETHPAVATSLNNLAEIYQAQGDYAAALPLYQRALSILATTLGETHPAVATSLNNLAEIYQAQGDYAAAFPLYQRALSIYETTLGETHPDVATSLNNLAEIYHTQGDYAAALPLYQRALAIRETALGETHPAVAVSLGSLASLYQTQGNYGAALPLYQRALAIRETVLGETHPAVATSLHNLAALYQDQGNYAAALPLYQRALSIYEAVLGETHPAVATSLSNLAELYRTQGDYAAALPLYQRALSIRETALGENHPAVATSLNNLAEFYRIQGNYAAVLPLYQRVLSIWKTALGDTHPHMATSLNNLSAFYQTQGDMAQALTYLRQGLDIQEHNLELNLPTLADAQRQAYATTIVGTTDAAISFHLQFTSDSPEATSLALTTLLRRKGRILDAGIDSRQTLRQHLTPDDQAQLDRLTAAQRQLANFITNPPRHLAPDQYRTQLDQLEKEVNDLDTALAQRSALFRNETQPVEIAVVQGRIPTNGVLVEYVRYQPFDATSPENPFGDPRYAAYLFFPDGRIEAVDLGEAELIDGAVQAFIRQLQDPNANFSRTTIEAQTDASISSDPQFLRTLILDPIAPYLTGVEHLLISPDSHLNRLPFEALLLSSGHYLIQDYQISYLNSGRDLLKLDVISPSTAPAVIVANPDYDLSVPPQLLSLKAGEGKAGRPSPPQSPSPKAGEGEARDSNSPLPLGEGTGERVRSADFSLHFNPLPGTAQEATAIQPYLPQATLLTQAQATENALKTVQAPRILHIATHGFFLADAPRQSASRSITVEPTDEDNIISSWEDDRVEVPVENPLLRSGLALAGSNRRQSGDEDGILTALEASGLDLYGTQLVVLSACETGLGDIANGEGVYGLRRAFALAGAETQLMSLWQVSDYGTQSLMALYYENLSQGMGRAEALRQVQLAMIQHGGQYSHPYYWAAFILTGDWRPMR